MGRRLVSPYAALALAFLLAPPVASAPRLTVEVADVATIVEGGAAVVVTLTVRGPRGGYEVLEAHASASQGGASGMNGFAPDCGGPEKMYSVRVASLGSPFVAGSATGGGFVLMLHRSGSTISASDTESITLQ